MSADVVDADLVALRRLVERYARAVDERDATAFADSFTEDGILVTLQGEVRGRAELVRVVERLARYRATMHLIGQHDVVRDANGELVGRTACAAQHAYDDDETGVARVHVMQLIYHDRYRQVGGGWRFAHRRLALLWDEDHPLRT